MIFFRSSVDNRKIARSNVYLPLPEQLAHLFFMLRRWISFISSLQVLDRFSDNLKVPDDGIPASPVSGELFEQDPARILFNIANRLKDIIEELEDGPMHRRPRREYRA